MSEDEEDAEILNLMSPDSEYSKFFKQYKNSYFPSTIVIERQFFESTLHRDELNIVAPNLSTLVVKVCILFSKKTKKTKKLISIFF